MPCALSTPLPLAMPHAGIGRARPAVGDDVVELRPRVAQAGQLQARCLPTRPVAAGSTAAWPARSSLTVWSGSHRGSSLLTTKAAEPPPPSGPWQFGAQQRLGGVVLGRVAVGEQDRTTLDGAVLEALGRVGAAERLPDEVRDERDDRDHERDQRDAEHTLEVRAFEHVVVVEALEVLGLFAAPGSAAS